MFCELSARLHSVIRFDFLNLILHDTARNTMRLHILETPTSSGGEIPQFDLPPEETPSGWVFLNQEKLVIPDVDQETRWPKVLDVLRERGIKSCCWLPLTTAQHRLGAMGFGYADRNEDILRQLELMQQVAAQVAVAVDNSLNYESSERYQEQLARERDRLQVLLEITNALVSELSSRELFASISASLRRIVHHEFASLALHRPGDNHLTFRELDVPPDVGEMDASIPIVGSPPGEAFTTRRPVVVGLDDLPRYPAKAPSRLRALGVRTLCCLPLITRNRVLGTLNVASVRENAFAPGDLEFLSQVASQAAIAIENSLAFREIAELRDQLTKEKLYLEDEIRTERNFGEIIGDSAAFRRVLQKVETVAPTDATVLVLGETGTGKELIARAIHDFSARRDRTFVKLNCAAIPTGLLESELFGHEKGAFTGAIAQKAGRFELAHKGTLFLDEIGDIPLELQPKLLRALQEQEFERLGSTRTTKVNVRLVAATNRDLVHMIAERQFRSDLYYRLNVFPIAIPPLRERVEDIPKLVRYFAQKYARRMNRAIEAIASESMEALVRYAWPGNVRELENLIERAVILSRGSVLSIPLSELQGAPDAQPSSTLADAEREHIRRILDQTNWRVGGTNGAAALLGMKRTTLQSKMKKLNITR